MADSLKEAGDRLLTFTRLPDSQRRSARTTNAIERLHEEFKRRIRPCCPPTETAAMLFWVLLASGQIIMRKVDRWQYSLKLRHPNALISPHDALSDPIGRRAHPRVIA
jgi:transposase-like protein